MKTNLGILLILSNVFFKLKKKQIQKKISERRKIFDVIPKEGYVMHQIEKLRIPKKIGIPIEYYLESFKFPKLTGK